MGDGADVAGAAPVGKDHELRSGFVQVAPVEAGGEQYRGVAEVAFEFGSRQDGWPSPPLIVSRKRDRSFRRRAAKVRVRRWLSAARLT